MSSSSRDKGALRSYHRGNCAVFRKTDEPHGGLSNMAGGFPIRVNDVTLLSSEALYQSCRFPHLPEVQLLIIQQKSPMTAKMVSKPHRRKTRPDWKKIRVEVMRWALRAKLVQNWSAFSQLLLDTGTDAIVEESRRDDFWGAKPQGEDELVGKNVLGRLLMELREEVRSQGREYFQESQPPRIENFLLAGRPIEAVRASESATPPTLFESMNSSPEAVSSRRGPVSMHSKQPALKPYPAMKDSGVESLGEVPEHWEVRQLGRIGVFSKGNGGTKADELEEGVPCVRYGDLYTRHRFFIEDTKACVSPERAVDYTPIEHGDVLFAGSGETIEEIGKSAVNLLTEPACCGGDVVIFRPSIEVDAKFLGIATDCPQATYQKSCMGRGITVMHVYGDELKYLFVTLPPLPEQVAIVRYLDHVDRRVRRLVRAKRKLIALLTEQKQAIIHRAVTRGLDLDVPLKDSGVEWLGEVPEHWGVRRSKQVFTQRKELARPGDIQLSATQAYGVIAQDEYEKLVGRKVVKVFLHLEKRRHVEMDDFVISMRSFQGGLERAWVSGCIRSSYVVLRPIAEVDVGFFSYLFKSRGYIGALQSTADFIRDGQDLNFANFCGVDLPVPPLEEQRRIADALQEALDDASRVMDRAKREIELLNEYRTRLIADVVTGKLDVRDAAAALPEVDPLDETEDAADFDATADCDTESLSEALEEVEA